jgi:hypothetical protein
MNNIKKFNKIAFMKIFSLASILSLLLVSCLPDNSVDDNSVLYEQQFQQMKVENYITPSDSIGYNVYMQRLNTVPNTDSTLATADDAIIMSYIGYDYAGKLLSTSYADIAEDNDVLRTDVIYGPTRTVVKYTIGGIWLALTKKMRVNDSVLLVIPSDMASGAGPVRFIVVLHKIIKSPASYEDTQREAYMNKIGFAINETNHAIDSTLWYNFLDAGGYPSNGYYSGETVKIKLKAYYCEYDSGIVTSIPGRQFFPINNVKEDLTYYLENTTDFPITPAIDSMLYIMDAKGHREAEFITTSDNTYGTIGFVHPYLGSYIVPPYMSVHYKLTIVP